MVDFLSPDINKFEEQMISFIEAYYTILTEDKESISTNIKIGSNDWWIKIKKLLKSFYNEDESKKGINLRIGGMIKYLEEIGKSGKNVEFYMIINIVHFLYEMYYNNKKKKKNERNILIEYKMAQSIYKELITLRNELSHNQNFVPSLEYILRLYEDFYYLIKFMKPDVPSVKVNMNEKFLRDIKMNIHIYLEKNLEYDKSFELNSLINEFKKLEEEMNINIKPSKPYKKLKLNKNPLTEEIKSLFDYLPQKLPKYDFKKEDRIDDKEKSTNNDISNINDENENEIEEEKKMNENSLDNSSNDSIVDYESFSSNSDRNSINEKEGNIKSTDETNNSISVSKQDIYNNI